MNKQKNKKIKCYVCKTDYNSDFRVVDEFEEHKYQGRWLCPSCLRRLI